MRSLAGRFCRSRAAFWRSATTSRLADGVARRRGRETISSCSRRRRRPSSVVAPCSGRTGRRRAACPRPAPRDDGLVDVVGHRPARASRRRARARAPERDGGRDPRALGRRTRRACRARRRSQRAARRASGARASFLKARLAPRRTSSSGRAAAERRRASWATPSPSNTPTHERVGVGVGWRLLAERGAHRRAV